MLQLEESKADPQFCALGKFLNAGAEHAFDLLKHLLAAVLHAVVALLLPALTLEGAVCLVADLLVLLDVADQQHVAVFITALAAYQLENVGDVLF